MTSKAAYRLTPEQLALSEERKRLKLLNKEQKEKEPDKVALRDDPRAQILPREWLRSPHANLPQQIPVGTPAGETRTVKVMTWNLLAQTLVRRTLFPTSDCLKSSQREHMLFNEILSHTADVICLQELDQTQKIFPLLDQSGYSYVYKTGPKKKHGSLIAFKKGIYTEVGKRTVEFDLQTVRPALSANSGDDILNERAARGSSFFTKNIGNLVALRRNSDERDGIVVATTHLFWHPRYTYERARQVGILFREVEAFRRDLNLPHWPCVVAGDFNFSPDDPAYSLLVGDPLLPNQRDSLAFSRVVHRSIDPSVPLTSDKAAANDTEEGATEAEDGDEQEQDPDRIIVNARRAAPEDGLLSDEELEKLFERSPWPKSAYDEGLQPFEDAESIKNITFGSRVDLAGRHGAFEPIWTSYTHYWKTVLDYIFVVAPSERPVAVVGIAKPHTTNDLDPGIPRKGVCGSDHISLCAELSFSSLPP
ncbi:Endonuclease/exonuclease/phosphatase [Trametopsis cervina]|nr:Endonuclease/exonuclease/phosphatase [Trametopsis cervina]